MVSNASDDLPDPDRPVMTTSLCRGMSTSMFLRLWTRAPRTAIHLCAMVEPCRPAFCRMCETFTLSRQCSLETTAVQSGDPRPEARAASTEADDVWRP